jgi:hypothetical protein
MRAVAKRFLRGSATAAKSHSFFDREFVAVSVDYFHFALHYVRTVLDCFDCYHAWMITRVNDASSGEVLGSARL